MINMSDVVLIFPKTGYDIKNSSVELPLSMLSLASVLIDDYDVKIIDQRIDKDWEKKLERELASGPLAVTVSAMTGTQITNALEVSKMVKESGSKTVWGGIHATILPYQTVQHSLVDYVIVGDGEFTLKSLLDVLSNKGDVKSIPNLVYQGKEHSVMSTKVEMSDPEKIPEVPFHLLDVEKYVKSGGMSFDKKERILPFISSRGCPYRCAYCSTGFLSERRWKPLSAEETVARVFSMKKKFNLDVVKFYDENFLSNPKRAEAIADGIDNQLKWSIQARMDNLLMVDLKKMEHGGLRIVEPGVESGSNRILSMINKDETKETMLKANRKLAETNIKSFYNFMMGFPTETCEEIMETTDFALELIRENKNAHVTGFYIYSPYPGSAIYNLALQHGFKAPESLEGWAEYSRQHRLTPWIQNKLEMMTVIMYSAKFVDGKRMKYVLRNTLVPSFVFSLFGFYFRRKWKKHDFRENLVLKVLKCASRIAGIK